VNFNVLKLIYFNYILLIQRMGVRLLNRYLQEFAPSALKEIDVDYLRGKRITIDISIFMYQFKGDNSLLESMYDMISLFREYDIVPIFVFDGIPPTEKSEVLYQRNTLKNQAKGRCNDIEVRLNNDYMLDNERKSLELSLKTEQKKCIRLTNQNIRDIKELIKIMGVSFIDASGEADELCVQLVVKQIAWGCMSEDMDMVVHGCHHILRSFNLKTKKAIYYSMNDILTNLNMTQTQFREVCLLAGTDYNQSRFTIYKTMGLFYKYLRKKRGAISFYDWLIYTKVITYDYKRTLEKPTNMFILKNYKDLKTVSFTNTSINIPYLNEYMVKHQFKYIHNV